MDKNPLVLLELVERLGNLMRTEMRKAGSDESLQPVHLQALIYLSKANRYSNTPQALADYLGLTKGTVSQTLLLLDRRGLIERFEDDIDRRVVRLRLSSAGEQLLAEAQPALAWQNATRNISPNRIRNATSALREALVTAAGGQRGRGVRRLLQLRASARSSRSASTAAARWATGSRARRRARSAASTQPKVEEIA